MSHTPSLISRTADWIAVNKPAGWLSIPGRGDAPVLSQWVEEQERNSTDPISGSGVWVCHRLDLQTSGVMIFARTAEAHRRANAWFERHEVRKTYELLASGSPRQPILKLDGEIEGRKAMTQLEVVERWPQRGFLGRARIVTGRRHQIRIHLSGAGFPLWGDPQYGGSAVPFEALRVERVALHSRRLELPDGTVAEAPWPADFSSWVEASRKK